MPWILITTFTALSMICAGTGIGWWLRGMSTKTEAPLEDQTDGGQPDNDGQDVARGVMDKLRQVAVSMSANVDEHNDKMLAINHQLTSDAGVEPEEVVNAINSLVEANGKMKRDLESAESRLIEQEQQIASREQEAVTDALTSLKNRRGFDDETARCEQLQREMNVTSSVMIIDVDHFKKFNDTHGHQAGDEVLRAVGRALKGAVTARDVVCRYGGEEFAIIYPGRTAERARELSEKARAAIGLERVEFEGKTLQVTASAGLAEFKPGEATASVIKRADKALYGSKDNGRNCGRWHDGEESFPFSVSAKDCDDQAETDYYDDDDDQSAGSDPITGLPGRDAFMQTTAQRVAESKRTKEPVAMLLLEVDDYAEMLQQQSEAVSKVLLRTTTQFLKAAMRDMDMVARFHSNQFSILLPGSGSERAETVGERLRHAIERCKLPLGGADLQFTVSIGGATVEAGDDANSLLQRAEHAVEQSKQAGGNAVSVCEAASA